MAPNTRKDNRVQRKICYTLFVLLFSLTLSEIPVIGLNSTYFSALFESTSILSLMDVMAGGALSKMSMAGFGITSYITATIITQLLSIIFPAIEKVRRDGHQGKKFMDRINFILAMIFTGCGSLLLSLSCGKSGMFVEYSPLYVLIAAASWTFGSAAIIFLASKIEDYGIGNGISLVLCCNIISQLPNGLASFCYAELSDKKGYVFLAAIGIVIAALYLFYLFVTYLQSGMLKIPVKQSKKQSSAMNSDAWLPIPVNIANVMPVIYATSIFSLPTMAVTVLGIETNHIADKILEILDSAHWYEPSRWYHIAGLVAFIVTIIAFGFFSSQMSFNPAEIADNMKKSGDTFPSVTPGADTVVFLEKRRKIMTVINLAFLIVISIVPSFICTKLGIPQLNILSTSLIIVISVMTDTALRFRAASIHNDKQFSLFGGKATSRAKAGLAMTESPHHNDYGKITSNKTIDILTSITWPKAIAAMRNAFVFLFWTGAIATALRLYSAGIHYLISKL